MMLHSPIIFLGYSLTDVNVRKIIKDFTKSLSSNELNILERKLVLVEWEKDQQELVEEVVNDKDLGCMLRVIKTDNFKAHFDKISTINKCDDPTEVIKYTQCNTYCNIIMSTHFLIRILIFIKKLIQ